MFEESLKHNVLCIGLCCLDDILEVHHYPKEDMDLRCISKYLQRGGNASNNCTVFGILGAKSSFFGVIANSEERKFIEKDFEKYDVDYSHAVIAENCECPVSTAIISQATGSRTILHLNKNLPEPSFLEFKKINISVYSWIHFEGRNVPEIQKMIEYIKTFNETSTTKIRISIEIEKTRVELKNVMNLADVVFVSKEFAIMEGCHNMDQAVEKLSKMIAPHAILICPWGDLGASAIQDGNIFRSTSFPPEQVVDTLGAGDTFIASTIYAFSFDKSVEESIRFGCQVTGTKVGIKGWEGLKQSINNLDFVNKLKNE